MTGPAIAMASVGPVITLANATITGIGATPSTATYTLESDGDIVKDEHGVSADLGDWIVPRANAGGDWEVMCTAVPDSNITVGSSARGSWLALSSNRAWICQRLTVPGTNTETLTIQIRRAATGVVKATCTITLNATI